MEILSKIEQCDDGAHFHKVDLHIHTPESKCYKESNVNPKNIVETAIKKGLKVIAICDHNSKGQFEQIAQEAEDKDLLVLPGVEITTPHGGERQVHILAIFDYTDFKKVEELLTKIGIPHEKRGASDAVSEKTILEIMKLVHNMGGISLLSHVDSKSGIDMEMPRSTPIKKKIIESKFLKAVEITNLETMKNYGGYTCVLNSDSHCLDEIGQRYTLVKMGKPSFEGLRIALSDFESRIRLNEEDSCLYPFIKGAIFEGGFLNEQIIHFNKNLNCLIGGKGTGKSTIIELVRFVLDSLSTISRIKEEEEKHIEDVLKHGRVLLAVKTKNGENYIVERTFGENPRILRENGEETGIDIKRFRENFFRVEVYSQNELLEISKSFKSQLKMIDQYIDLKDLKDTKNGVLRDLETNKRLILDIRKNIDELKSQKDDLDLINEKLQILEKRGIKDELSDYVLWEEEKGILGNIKEQLQEEIKRRQDALNDLKDNRLKSPEMKALKKLPNSDLISKTISILEKSKEKLERKIEEEIKVLQEDLEQVSGYYEEWNKEYQNKKKQLRKSLSDLEKENIPIKDYEDFLELEGNKRELEGTVENIRDKKKEIQDLEKKRADKIKEFKKIKEKIFNKRKELTIKINSSLSGFVRIKIEKEGDNSHYKEFLVDDVLSSADYRIVKSKRAKIADKLHPMKFADILRKEDSEKLEKETGFSNEIAQKVIRLAKIKLYQIERIELEDKISLEFNDKSWKEIGRCSDGQKCTAILSIAMFERDTPLIIDQPEDSLDNNFIFREVVKNLRKIKNKRQLIIATHNANIPVLGDSELMLVMKSNGLNGFVTERGAIDKEKIKVYAQDILEGGKEAFERRKLKYGI
ncbi:MAG: PHP domain-containing protein [Candidatus Methanofastidiosia archaeon]|jgi:ABC-type cobalamin/Fe3+-siderophores transport system ATPase subunit/histidinol phosphatase-like PHP family hydrolase